MAKQDVVKEFRRIIKNKYFILGGEGNYIIKFTETSDAQKNPNRIAYKIIDIRDIQSQLCLDLFDSSMFEKYLL